MPGSSYRSRSRTTLQSLAGIGGETGLLQSGLQRMLCVERVWRRWCARSDEPEPLRQARSGALRIAWRPETSPRHDVLARTYSRVVGACRQKEGSRMSVIVIARLKVDPAKFEDLVARRGSAFASAPARAKAWR